VILSAEVKAHLHCLNLQQKLASLRTVFITAVWNSMLSGTHFSEQFWKAPTLTVLKSRLKTYVSDAAYSVVSLPLKVDVCL